MSEKASAGPAVLLVGNYVHTLSVVRSLGAAGHHVIVGRAGPTWQEERSRFTAEVWDHPPLSAGPEFIRALVAFLQPRRRVAVFPMGDLDSLFLARHADALQGLTTLVMPAAAIVEACQDKLEMLRIARELDIPHTEYALVTDHRQLLAAGDAIGYPCVVKPRHARGGSALPGRKAVICPTGAALRSTFPHWPGAHDGLLVQRYAPGRLRNVHFAAASGRWLRHMQNQTLRTDALDGTGISTEQVSLAPSPRLTDYTERLVRRLDYTGVGLTQFIVDEATGAVCFLELNARLPGGTAFSIGTGLDLPRLALDAAGLTPAPEGATPAVGIKFAWTSRDLVFWLRAVYRREVGAAQALRWLGQILRGALTADVHCTWRRDDPIPVLACWGQGLIQTLRGATARLAGRQARATPS